MKASSASGGDACTVVCCPVAGCGFKRIFWGKRIDPVTGQPVPVTFMELPNVAGSFSDEQAVHNAKSLSSCTEHCRVRHRLLKYKPRYAGFNYRGRTPEEPGNRQSEEQRLMTNSKRAAARAELPDTGAGTYLSEALVQAEEQLRGLDLHPVHPPVGSGMRTQKAQCLSTLLNWAGLLGSLNTCEPRSAWLWDTDEWEPAWMSEDTLKRASLDGILASTLGPNEDALIGREWRALQAAWRAAEGRYASVLEELQQGRQVPDMNGCYEIQNLRMLVKSLDAYVTACDIEARAAAHPVILVPATKTAFLQRGTPVQARQAGEPWLKLWEDRVWEVATELAEDMYERRVTKKARATPATTQPAVTNPPPPMPSSPKTSPQPLADPHSLRPPAQAEATGPPPPTTAVPPKAHPKPAPEPRTPQAHSVPQLTYISLAPRSTRVRQSGRAVKE